MRIILAVFIWILFAGGLVLYMDYRNPAPASANRSDADSKENSSLNQRHYILEITPAFAAEPDPFALQTETGNLPPALLARMGKNEILRVTDPMEAGIPLRVDPLTGVSPGENEIWFEASPPVGASGASHALRMRILENSQVLADQTFWSHPGGNMSGAVRFIASPHLAKESDHAHP